MCTSSPGEQSLARRVKPTISAYSILQIKQTSLVLQTSTDMCSTTTRTHKWYMPDVGVSLHVEVVKVIGVLHLAKVWTLQSLDDLSFHDASDVGWQQ